MGMFDGLKKLVRGANAEAGPMGWDNTTQKQWSDAPAEESDSGKTFEDTNAMKWDNVKNAPATDDPAGELVQPGDSASASGEDISLSLNFEKYTFTNTGQGDAAADGDTSQVANNLKQIGLNSSSETHDAADDDASTLVMKEGETSGEMVKMGSEASFESDATEVEGLDELSDV
jgi:hypothetical protein